MLKSANKNIKRKACKITIHIDKINLGEQQIRKLVRHSSLMKAFQKVSCLV